MEKESLYIPVQTPDADDFIAGIGVVEVGIIGFATALAIFMGVLLAQLLHNTLYGVFLGAVIIGLSILVYRRDQYNENMIKKYKVVTGFVKAQKRYMYYFYDTYNQYDEVDLEAYEE